MELHVEKDIFDIVFEVWFGRPVLAVLKIFMIFRVYGF